MRFLDLKLEYLQEYLLEHDYSTYQKLYGQFKIHYKYLDKMTLPLTINDLQQWRIYIVKKQLSFSTNRSLYYSLKRYLDWLDTYHNYNNVIKKLPRFKNRDVGKVPQFWNVEEYHSFIKYSRGKFKILFQCAMFGGFRLGELLAFKKFNIVQDGIYVTHTRTKGRYKKTKCGDSSTGFVSLPSNLLIDLQNAICGKNGFIFPFSENTVNRYKDKICQTHQIKRIEFRDIRRSYAHLCLSNKIGLETIQSQLRHTCIETTRKYYASINYELVKANVKRLNKYL